VTPAGWKRREVRERLDDGATFEDAVVQTQCAYIDRQENTLIEGSFADWVGRGSTEL
jgi:hypothetical protein